MSGRQPKRQQWLLTMRAGMLAWCTVLAMGLAATLAQAAEPEWHHATALTGTPKYGPEVKHFDYVNPEAPKAGRLRAAGMGTYDSFNGILDRGRVVGGVWRLGEAVLVYDRLLEQAVDEPASYYGRLAEGVWVSDDFI